MTYDFTGDYKTKFKAYIDELYERTKRGELPRAERMKEVERLTDEYIEATGKRPDIIQLDRLSTLILREELVDTHPDKVTREEYPIMSDTQLARREDDEHLIADMQNGRDKVIGYRKTFYEDDAGVTHAKRQKIYEYMAKN